MALEDDIIRENARRRYFEIMRRHIRAADWGLSDHEFVRTVMGRYEQGRGLALIDPNE